MSKPTSGITLAILCAVTTSAGGCAHTFERPAGAPVYSVAQLKAELEARGKDFALPAEGLIVKVEKGSVMPVDLRASLPFATLEPGENRVRVERDVWLLVSASRMAISADGERWARVEDLRTINQLFGSGGRGSFQLGVGMTPEGPRVTAAVAVPAR